ncbi:MAG: DUF1858 domain-containing protein [Candidatus Micrarchaeota archaeon]
MIKKDMTIGQVIREHPDSIPIFLKNGLTCIGCPMSSMETVEQGAEAHGINVEKLISELNGGRKEKNSKKKKK